MSREMRQIADRFTRLINILESKTPKQLDMSKWYDEDETGKCGTVACAAGWAAQDPYFKRLGLRIVEVEVKYPGWDEKTFQLSGVNGEDSDDALSRIFGTSLPFEGGWSLNRKTAVIKMFSKIRDLASLCETRDQFEAVVAAMLENQN